MTANNKPEWFEIFDNDEKPELRKVSKSLPVSAVLVAALILGVGAVTAQTQNITPFSASEPDATQTIQSESAPTTAEAVAVGAVATNKLANPAISKLPAGGDDEDDDDDHGRDHEDEDEGDDD